MYIFFFNVKISICKSFNFDIDAAPISFSWARWR